MSFLGSLLSDITGVPAQQRTQRPVPSSPKSRSDGATSERPIASLPQNTESLERKASTGPPRDDSQKAPKLGTVAGSPITPTKPLLPNVVPLAKPTANPPTILNGSVASTGGLVGKAVPAVANTAKATSSAPPKKGSFRDLMERGKKVHEAQKAHGVGQIKHKQALKLSRHERLKLALQDRDKGKASVGGRMQREVQSPRPGSSHTKNSKSEPVAVVKKKERPPLDYKGTMRNDLQNKNEKKSSAGRTSQQPHRVQRNSPDEDLVDYGGDDGYNVRYCYAGSSDDYDDEDDSDDMAGGGFEELEAEEERSLRVARKEDEAAMREEARHRNEKMARKQKLEELRQARAAKGR